MRKNLQDCGGVNMDGIYKEKPAVANLGIIVFHNALESQECKCVQIRWIPPYQQTEEIETLLDEFL